MILKEVFEEKSSKKFLKKALLKVYQKDDVIKQCSGQHQSTSEVKPDSDKLLILVLQKVNQESVLSFSVYRCRTIHLKGGFVLL